MRKIILSSFAVFIFSTLSANAQVSLQASGSGSMNQLSFSKRSNFVNKNIVGSQFINDKFSAALVNNGTTPFQIRFNVYNNIMEYNKDGEILNLTKEQNPVIEFTGTSNGKYKLTSYTDKRKNEEKDYMRVVYEGNKVSFLTLEKIDLKAATKASNSYESDKEAEYIRAKDERYMTLNTTTAVAPSKVKELAKLIPSKEKEIKDFVKANKIDFNEDADLKKLGTYLDSIL